MSGDLDDSTDVRSIPVTGSQPTAGRQARSGDADRASRQSDDVVTVDTRGRRGRPSRVTREPASPDAAQPQRTRASGAPAAFTVREAERPPLRTSAAPLPVRPGTATGTGTGTDGGATQTGTRAMPASTQTGTRAMPARTPVPPAGGTPGRAPSVGPGGATPYGAPPRPTRRRHPVRWTLLVLLLLLVAWLGSEAWAASSAWNAVHRVAATPTGRRPAAGSGTNYLLVGSDSRAGLTKAQKKKYATGNAAGQRTDSIMLIHRPASGSPTLVSIPRDSYVAIRGHGKNKVNAAFAYGGPKLLVQTVEQATGLRVDGYVEVGFGGFASVVDSLGGVQIHVKHAMKDKKAGINLKKGTQVLNGKNALGYVRARYSDPLGDLGRVQRQRQFLGALMSKAAQPANVLLPWRLHTIGSAGASAITVGNDDSLRGTAQAFLALRSVAKGDGQSLTVPISNPGLPTGVGDVVVWDKTKAAALFTALRKDTPLSVKP